MPIAIKKHETELVYLKGKPSAVILDINVYREMLEQLEEIEDIKALDKIREQGTSFRSFEDFVKELE